MIKTLVLLLILHGTTGALGDSNVSMLSPEAGLLPLPNGSQILAEDGESYRIFSLEEFKTILHIYTDYRSWGLQIPQLDQQVKLCTELTENQDKQISSLTDDHELLRKENQRLLVKWEKENKLRHEAENRPWYGSWVAWSVAAVATAAAAVLTGALIAQ
jgi:hypothetical protein